MHPKLRKAVFPVAGLGSRFLPVTKASPKEMLPIVDKPLIQYAVEEAAAAGITEMIFVTGRNKRAIEDHFDKAYELETELERKNKGVLLGMVRSVLPEGARCIYIRQAEPLGLRSEEHTSELQSLAYLVCRLLLEKKKKNIVPITVISTQCILDQW